MSSTFKSTLDSPPRLSVEEQQRRIDEENAEIERKRIADLPRVWDRKIGEAFVAFNAAMLKLDAENRVISNSGDPATVTLALGLVQTALLTEIADALRGIEWELKNN